MISCNEKPKSQPKSNLPNLATEKDLVPKLIQVISSRLFIAPQCTTQRPILHVVCPKHSHSQTIHIVLVPTLPTSALHKVLAQSPRTFLPPALSRPSYYTSRPHTTLSEVTLSDWNSIVSYSASHDVYHSSQNHKHKPVVTKDNFSLLDGPTNRLGAGVKNSLVAYDPRKLPYLPPTIPNWQSIKRQPKSFQPHWSLT